MTKAFARRALIVSITAIICASAFSAGTRGMWSTSGTWMRTRQDDELIALSMASKNPTTGVVYLARDRDDLEALEKKIAALGGKVLHTDPAIDYIRAVVPTGMVLQALDVPAGNVAGVDVDLSFHNPRSALSPGEQMDLSRGDLLRLQAEADNPVTRAFMRAPSPILHDLNADTWRKQHPTFDGRGVTVADVEELADLTLPELSGALTLDGKPIRKIESFRILTDPGDHAAPNHNYDFANQWVDMHVRVSGSGSIAFKGSRYRLPHPGAFRIGMFDFNKAALASYWLNPTVLEPTIGNGIFAVLWEPATGLVWVDLHRTHDFRTERALRDFNRSGDWAYFGSWHSERYPDVIPAAGFGVLVDPAFDAVAIALGQGVHASGVVTTIAGRPIGPNDPVHGIAPAAQVASFEYTGSKLHSQAEAVIAAFEDPRVDVIVYEWDSTIHTNVEQGWFMGALGERLVRTFNKPLFVPGDNQAQIMAIDDAGTGPDVLAITGWQSAASYNLYEGFRPSTNVHKHWGGLTDGPGQDGALKPDVAAPSGYVAALPRFLWDPKLQRHPGLYTLPVGFWDFGGTSQATPTAGAATALLVSAEKQRGLHVPVVELANALRYAALASPALHAHEQGNGLLDIAATWKLLEAHSLSYPVARVCAGSVRTGRWPDGAPNGGAGILETNGWHTGDRGTRTMRFCFAGRPPAQLRATLALNDGTYAISAVRPDAGGVAVTVRIHPAQAGFHTALVQLQDALGRPRGRGMVAVAAALSLTRANHYASQQDVLIPRPGYTATFVDVPKGTDALIVQANRDVPFTVSFQDPSGNIYDYVPNTAGAGKSSQSVTIPQPTSGTWTILLADTHDVYAGWSVPPNLGTRDLLPVEPASAHISAQAVRVERSDAAVPASAFANVPVRRVGSVRAIASASGRFPSENPVLIPLDVAGDADALMVDLTGTDAWVDAYLFDCRIQTCSPFARILGAGSDKRLTIPDVKPGRYVLALDDYAPAHPGGGLPSYRLSAFTYSHLGVQSDAAAARAFEVNCSPNGGEITASPACGLFMTDGN